MAVLAERNRIAQEIHDGIAQAFTGILLQLGAVEPRAENASGPHAALLTRVEDLAREGLAEARRSVMALRPAPSRCRGLESALRELAQRSTVPGRVTTTLESSAWPTRFTPEHEHELLRIAQEAVSNAVRHARPQTIRISMADDDTHWALSVADDGCGLRDDPEISAQEGFGLTSMRERAAAIGAEWSIRSGRDSGNVRRRAHTEAEFPMTTASKLRLILADDHPVVRDGLAAIINQQQDMEVVAAAENGEEAVTLYERHRPEVMVLDLRMPKKDGVAVVEDVISKHANARILIMTTHDGDEDIFRCLTQGAMGYLLKDAGRQEILSAIRTLGEGRQYTSSSVAVKALQRMGKPTLTQREIDVLQLLAQGRSNKDVARQLTITEGTAKTHVKAILTKLDAMSRTEAVAIAHKRGLIHL